MINSTLLHDIDIPGIGLCRANLAGPVVVERSDPYTNAAGLMCIDTEIVSMRLEGEDPVCGPIIITVDPIFASVGGICEMVPGPCFPANSWFRVYVRVELPRLGMCLYACQPALMECVIDRIPPFRCLYNLDVGDGDVIPLFRGPCDVTPNSHPCRPQPPPPPPAVIIKAVHHPRPPEECECYPEAGEDVMFTSLGHSIDLPGFGLTCTDFRGPMVVRRSDPYINADGVCCIDTEVVRMRMVGRCEDGSPAIITLNRSRRSRGFICAQEANACYPARSCFDIFFELRSGPDVLRYR